MRIRRFYHSIADAWHGLGVVYRSEQNFRLQIALAIVVVALMGYFHLPTWQIIVLVLLIAVVLVLEIINTAVEYFTDVIKPRLSPQAGTIKDMMAGAVLVTSCAAIVIGLIIFVPYFIALIK